MSLITQFNRALFLGLCVALVSVWAAAIRGVSHNQIRAMDFAQVYYGARSALKHNDPYDQTAVLRQFEADGGQISGVKPDEGQFIRTIVAAVNYPPTTLLAVAPLALLPWHFALTMWLTLMDALLVLAALLIWDMAAERPVLAGCIICFILLNNLFPLWFGNPIGIAVPLCVIAAWCFFKERFGLAGVMLLTLSLALKPQVGGFVWLYFLLTNGTGRKRALQTLMVAGTLSLCAVIWISLLSPHWIHEMQRNIAVFTAPGGANDPSPSGNTYRGFDRVISLQSPASVFWDNPRFYNATAYLIGGGLILIWALAVLRKHSARGGELLALAAISILTLLPVYHRTHDAKLLLLTIPACTMLWARGGARRWIALGLTSAAIFVTSDVPNIVLSLGTKNLQVSASTLDGKLTLLALQPAPLVLLTAGCFYLWVYVRWRPDALADKATGPKMAAAAHV